MNKSFLTSPLAVVCDGRVFLRAVSTCFFLSLASVNLFGQGGDNPTGVGGVFNGNSTTGCSYDPYTANAMRVIPDLTVAGAVGAYPLQWARIMNSRLQINKWLGAAGGWKHSYQWNCSIFGDATSTPDQYTVYYPDGRKVTFGNRVGLSYTGPLGVTDRFTGCSGTGDAFLLLSDGGKVKFPQTGIPDQGGGYNFTIDQPDEITDPYGLVTTLTYDTSDRLIEVKEPAGRKLKIYYGTIGAGTGYISEVDALASDGHVSQWVKYTYAAQTFGAPYNVLTRADYIYTAPQPPPFATYVYQASNVASNGVPLIKTCTDVRYPGPMKKIWYDFKAGGSYGQLWREKNIDGTVVATLTVSGVTGTEARGDGPTRSFTYGATPAGGTNVPYLLKSFTDFNAKATILGYDANGHVNSIQDPNLHTTTFTRIAATGVITKITHPGDGSYLQYTYTDPLTGYYLDNVRDELGNYTYYIRNSDMTTQEIDYPDGGVEKYTYNGFDQVVTHTMPSNTATGGASTDSEKYSYDTTNGLLLTYTPPATTSDPAPSPHPTRYHYDANDHLDTITDPKGNITTLDHNEIGQLTLEEHADADTSQIIYSYNADGTLASKNEQLTATEWATTSYTYDDYKRKLTLTTPDRFSGDTMLHTTKFWYDKTGLGFNEYTHTDANVTRLVLPSGKITKTVYGPNLRPDTVTVGYGTGDAATTDYAFDPAGNLLSVKDPRVYETTYFYDERDRLIHINDPISTDRNSDGYTVSYTYDLASNKKTVKRANDQLTTYDTYDTMNRLTQMTVGQYPTASAVTNFTWTKAGKLDTMTDPGVNGTRRVYNYDYDLLNRLATTTYPGGTTETRTYDIAGNLLTFKNRNAKTQTFTYDSRNRELAYSWNDGGVTPSRTITWDDASRMKTCNTTNSFINFVYYNDNLLHTQETWGTGSYGDGTHHTITYDYNADNNRLSAAMFGTVTLGYEYTNRNQLSAVTNGVGGASYVDYLYDKSGNINTRTLNNGTSTSFGTRDALNRITSMTHTFVGASRTLNYAYDEVNRRKYVQRVGDNVGDDGFGYDNNDQLTSFYANGTLSGGEVTTGTHTTLAFDASGNRDSVTVGSATTNYDPVNVLNQYPKIGTLTLTYGPNGNMISYNGSTYGCDAMSRLTSALAPGATDYFYYDGLGRQVARTINGTVTYTVWDGWNLYAEYTGGSSTPTERFVYGAGDDLVQSPLKSQYYYPDALGSTAYVAGASGNLLESYTYDVGGKPTVYDPSGTVRTGGTIYGITHLFGGHRWYSVLGLYDCRHRFLRPDIGRFLQPDPIGFAGDPANLYRYCANNPVNWSDPSGLWAFQLGLSFTVNWGLVAGTGSVGFAVDGHGNFGFFRTGGGGIGPGGEASGGITVHDSPDADTIFDLRDLFNNVSVGAGAGIAASVDGFRGTTTDGRTVHGGGFTFGLGAGGGGYAGVTNTWITPLYQPSVPDQITSTATDGGHEADGTPIIKIHVDASTSSGAPTEGQGKAPRGSPKPPNFGAAGLPIPTGGVLGPGGLAGLGPDAVFGSVTPPGNVIFLENPFSGAVDGQLARAQP